MCNIGLDIIMYPSNEKTMKRKKKNWTKKGGGRGEGEEELGVLRNYRFVISPARQSITR